MVNKGDRSEGLPENGGEGEMQGEMRGIGAATAGVSMDPQIQTEIGKHLRAIYDDVINEPVPSKFMELLEQLERTSGKG